MNFRDYWKYVIADSLEGNTEHLGNPLTPNLIIIFSIIWDVLLTRIEECKK